LDFFTSEKKIRANIRYWEAKVLLRRRGAQDQEKRAVLGSGFFIQTALKTRINNTLTALTSGVNHTINKDC
jgi:hypothetical protein